MKRILLLSFLTLLPLRSPGAQVLIEAGTTLPGGRTIINDNFTELYLLNTATIQDLADGTIATNLVNTANPWADNEVADNLTITGSVGAGTLDASGFNGNLTTGDNTVQEIAQKLDDLATGGGSSDFDALTAATEADIDTDDVFAVSHDGTEKKITLENMIDLFEAQTWTFSSMSVTTLDTTVLQFEGATADAFETTLGVVDPTADNSILLPNASGTVALASTAAGTHASPNTGAETPTWTGTTHTVWQGDAATINLPAAAGYANRGIIIYSTASSILTVEPNGSEVIVRDGTAQTGGVNFTLSAAAGNYVALISDGTRWITLGFKGVLTVGS